MTDKEKSKILGYSINLDERGYFEADVRDKSGKTIWTIDSATAKDLHEDGLITDHRNPAKVEEYLKDVGVIGKEMTIIKLSEAESSWDDEDVLVFLVPQFEGFYNSTNGALIEDSIDSMFRDKEGESEVPDEFHTHFTARGEIVEKFGEIYVDAYKAYLSLHGIKLPSLEFVEITHPKEYNFETDRLFVSAKASEVEAALKEWHKNNEKFVSLEQAREFVKDLTKSNSGFHSHYTELFERSTEYDDPRDWFLRDVYSPIDHNETGVILGAVIGDYEDSSILSSHYMNISETVQQMIEQNMPIECKQILRDFDSRDDSGRSPGI